MEKIWSTIAQQAWVNCHRSSILQAGYRWVEDTRKNSQLYRADFRATSASHHKPFLPIL